MDETIPNKLTNLEKEIKETRKQFKRERRIENIANIALIILGISGTIAIWITFNQRMENQAWQEGYERGYEQSQWDYIDREINYKDC